MKKGNARVLSLLMPNFIPLCVVIGVLLSDYLIGWEGWIPWIFAFLMFIGSLNCLRHLQGVCEISV